MAKSKNNNKILGLIIGFGILIIGILLPCPDGLTVAGKNAIALLLACVVLWGTQALPLIITSFLGLIAMPYLGIMEFTAIWPAFGSMVLFFVMASFGISAAMLKTNIPRRIIDFILRISKGNSKIIVLGFIGATGLVSAVISDIPAVVIFAEVGVSIISAAGISKDNPNNFAKAMMIGIPAGSLIGGTATPAGNSLNLMVMNGLEAATGVKITFVGWAIAGIPFAIITILGVWLILCKVFPPEPLPQQCIDDSKKAIEEIGPMDAKEKKYLIIMLLIVASWIASSWFSFLNIAATALIGLAIMMLPGIEIMTGKEYVEGVNWEVVVMTGCIIAMGTGIQQTGAITWLMSGILNNASAIPYIIALLIVSLIPCVIHVFLPLAGVIYALAFLPVIEFAGASGVSYAIAAFIFGVWMNNEYILPIDTIVLLSYGHGYFTTKDLMKAGIFITLLILIITVVICPLLAPLMTVI